MVRHRNRGPVSTSTAHLAGSALTCPCHICALYQSAEEQYALLIPYVKEGVDAGDRIISFVAPYELDERVNRFRRAGIDVDGLERQGRLEIVSWDQVYLREGYFDVDAMLALAQETLNDGIQRGFERTRAWGNMEWALEDARGVENLAIYESRINYILPLYQNASVCAYDVGRFSADVLEDVTRAHPQFCAGGWAGSHPLYVPPEQLVPEFESRKH